MLTDLKNLYNGDEKLSKVAHKLFHEKWWTILDHLQESAFGTFSGVFQEYINTFLGKVPLRDLLTE